MRTGARTGRARGRGSTTRRWTRRRTAARRGIRRRAPPPPREDSLCLASLLAFRVYDGYQRQESLTRDTLQRFLSDVHGEESYKQPAVRSVLDRIFAEGGNDAAGGEGEAAKSAGGPRALGAINPDIFHRGLRSSVAFLPVPASTRAGGGGYVLVV